MKSDSLSDGSCRMRESMSFAGRKEGLDFWFWCAAFRAFFALEREVMGLRDLDGLEDEEEESLSFSGAFSAAEGSRDIMSLPASGDKDASILAKEKSGSSKSCEVFVVAMA